MVQAQGRGRAGAAEGIERKRTLEGGLVGSGHARFVRRRAAQPGGKALVSRLVWACCNMLRPDSDVACAQADE